MFEVQAGEPRKFRVYPALCPDFQVTVIESEVRAPHVFSRGAGALLHQQGRIDPQAFGVRAITDDAQRVVSLFDQFFRVLMRPAEDQVGPLFHVVPPQLAYFGVV